MYTLATGTLMGLKLNLRLRSFSFEKMLINVCNVGENLGVNPAHPLFSLCLLSARISRRNPSSGFPAEKAAQAAASRSRTFSIRFPARTKQRAHGTAAARRHEVSTYFFRGGGARTRAKRDKL